MKDQPIQLDIYAEYLETMHLVHLILTINNRYPLR